LENELTKPMQRMEGGNPYAKDKTLNYLKMESTIMEKIAKLEQ